MTDATAQPARMNIMIGTAGHVDHGKTALVKLLTGCETDTLREEKERGLSINLGFAPCSMRDDRVVGIVDVPGHERFIKNMVAGAAGIDLMILVIAADDGVMPQTREHLDIVTLLGVRHGLVVLTKTDLVDAEHLELAEEDAREFVAGTFLERAPLAAVSNVTAQGFDEFYDALNEVLAQIRPKPVHGVFRLPVERAFTAHGFGTVVTGIPVSGRILAGDKVEHLPSGRTGRIRNMQVYGSDSNEGRAGECVALNIPEFEPDLADRGNTIAAPGYFRPVDLLEAHLSLLPRAAKPLKHLAEVRFHTGTSEVIAKAALLDRDELAPAESGYAQFRLQQPIVVGPGDRFVIRQTSPLVTIGGGVIVSTLGHRLRRTRPQTLATVREHHHAVDDECRLAAAALKGAGHAGMTEPQLAKAALVPKERSRELAESLVSDEAAIRLEHSGRLVHKGISERLADDLLSQIEQFHRRVPIRLGALPSELPIAAEITKELVQRLIASLIASGRINQDNGRLRAPNHQPAVTEGQRQLQAQLERCLAEAGLQTPSVEEMADRFGRSVEETQLLLELSADENRAMVLEGPVWFLKEAVDRATETVLADLRQHGRRTSPQLRDLLGTSRKYAIPILDLLDRSGLTKRVGDHRIFAQADPSTGQGERA